MPPWITQYKRQLLWTDVLAGLIVAVLVIPQSLAYALLAGLPPQAGLYVSILPVLVYAWVGSSMTQAVGPVAITAIMTYAVLSPLAVPGSNAYIALAAALSLCSGVLIFVFGLLRLGFLSQLLSRPVVSGFISGSAILIVVSQLKFLLGVQIPAGNTWHTLQALLGSLSFVSPVTVLLGGSALVWLLVCRWRLVSWAQRVGTSLAQAEFLLRVMPLVVLALAVALVVGFDLDHTHQVAVVGPVREGGAGFQFFVPNWGTLQTLAAPALVLAFIGTVQNITMAQALAAKRRERVDANRELVGFGLSNVMAGFYGGMPVGGGLSRSAINVSAGAQSPLASLVAAVAMLCMVLLGTHWLERLPLAVLAASIVVAAVGMIEVKAFWQAWSYDRADAMALLGTALGVLVFGLGLGVAIGIGLSLATLLVRASTPHIAVIGRIPGTEHFRNIERHGVETIDSALFLRIDESLFFGNLSAVEARLSAELVKAPLTQDVVLIMSAVNRVDTTALEVLTDINRDLGAKHMRLHFAEVKGPVQDRLVHSALWKGLSGRVYLSVHAAFEDLQAAAKVKAELA
ncbi:sulfate permease [Rhodoferax aquaticus]|uniref:Sulfate permease n=1 Tax=Rhodoferax aquaticus TaxID=2527691 RepID=A0A515EVS0_9BURK|nr:sulfate permease [Rhodoferax aquaticus]